MSGRRSGGGARGASRSSEQRRLELVTGAAASRARGGSSSSERSRRPRRAGDSDDEWIARRVSARGPREERAPPTPGACSAAMDAAAAARSAGGTADERPMIGGAAPRSALLLAARAAARKPARRRVASRPARGRRRSPRAAPRRVRVGGAVRAAASIERRPAVARRRDRLRAPRLRRRARHRRPPRGCARVAGTAKPTRRRVGSSRRRPRYGRGTSSAPVVQRWRSACAKSRARRARRAERSPRAPRAGSPSPPQLGARMASASVGRGPGLALPPQRLHRRLAKAQDARRSLARRGQGARARREHRAAGEERDVTRRRAHMSRPWRLPRMASAARGLSMTTPPHAKAFEARAVGPVGARSSGMRRGVRREEAGAGRRPLPCGGACAIVGTKVMRRRAARATRVQLRAHE